MNLQKRSCFIHSYPTWGFRCWGIEGDVGETLEGVVREGVAFAAVVDPLFEALEIQGIVAPAEALKDGLVLVFRL